MINCIYAPNGVMRVVEDEEYENLLKTGEWFRHPNEAKSLNKEKEQDNEKISIKKRRGRISEQNAEASRI